VTYLSPDNTWATPLLQLAGTALAGRSPLGDSARSVTVEARPAHPANRVDVEVREPGGTPLVLPASRILDELGSGSLPQGAQLFSAQLPPSLAGRAVDYRFVLSRAGQLLATLPANGSWLSTADTPPPAIASPLSPPQPNQTPVPAGAAQVAASAVPDAPRWAYDLQFFSALTVNLRAEVVGATPEGYRINFYVKDGTVKGPSIDAKVRPEGGDWMCIRPDGIGMVDISITYETSDGALILERAGGVFDLGPDGYSKVVEQRFEGSPPFYATPSWDTAHPKWQWINRLQGFGVGRVVLDVLQVRCDIYVPTVGGPLTGA
jgi:hypothetical protein